MFSARLPIPKMWDRHKTLRAVEMTLTVLFVRTNERHQLYHCRTFLCQDQAHEATPIEFLTSHPCVMVMGIPPDWLLCFKITGTET
jgi:hypothetical protein